MFVAGTAAAEENQCLVADVSNGMQLSWLDGNCITTSDGLLLVLNRQFTAAGENKVDLVAFGGQAWLVCQSASESSLGQALVPYTGITVGQQFADPFLLVKAGAWSVFWTSMCSS